MFPKYSETIGNLKLSFGHSQVYELWLNKFHPKSGYCFEDILKNQQQLDLTPGHLRKFQIQEKTNDYRKCMDLTIHIAAVAPPAILFLIPLDIIRLMGEFVGSLLKLAITEDDVDRAIDGPIENLNVLNARCLWKCMANSNDIMIFGSGQNFIYTRNTRGRGVIISHPNHSPRSSFITEMVDVKNMSYCSGSSLVSYVNVEIAADPDFDIFVKDQWVTRQQLVKIGIIQYSAIIVHGLSPIRDITTDYQLSDRWFGAVHTFSTSTNINSMGYLIENEFDPNAIYYKKKLMNAEQTRTYFVELRDISGHQTEITQFNIIAENITWMIKHTISQSRGDPMVKVGRHRTTKTPMYDIIASNPTYLRAPTCTDPDHPCNLRHISNAGICTAAFKPFSEVLNEILAPLFGSEKRINPNFCISQRGIDYYQNHVNSIIFSGHCSIQTSVKEFIKCFGGYYLAPSLQARVPKGDIITNINDIGEFQPLPDLPIIDVLTQNLEFIGSTESFCHKELEKPYVLKAVYCGNTDNPYRYVPRSTDDDFNNYNLPQISVSSEMDEDEDDDLGINLLPPSPTTLNALTDKFNQSPFR